MYSRPERVDQSVLCTCQQAGECVPSRGELLRLGLLIPLMFSLSSPLIQELLVLTCTVADCPAKDIKHMHTSLLTHTHTRFESDVDSFMIYRQYL